MQWFVILQLFTKLKGPNNGTSLLPDWSSGRGDLPQVPEESPGESLVRGYSVTKDRDFTPFIS